MENNERRNHSDFVAGDDESMSEIEGAEPAQAVYARQQIDAAAALFDMPRAERLKQLEDASTRNTLRSLALQETSRPASAVPSRPASVVPSPAMRRPSSAMRRPPPVIDEPTAEEEAMADEAQQFAENTHAGMSSVGPPEDHLVMPMDGEDEHADGQNTLYDGVAAADAGAFDDLQGIIATQEIEGLLNPPTYDGHD